MDKTKLEEKDGSWIVYVMRERGWVPILKTKRKEEAELLISYYTNL